MISRLCLYVLASLIIPCSSLGASNNDPRFFGSYCGEDKVCKSTFIGKRCKDIKNIVARLKYTETEAGGLVHGSGTGNLDGNELNFVIAGVVVDKGVFRGSATVRGVGSRAGWAYLSDDGTRLTIYAENQDIKISKFECNNTPPQVTITDFPTAPVSFGQTMFFLGEVTDAQSVSFPPERLVWKSDDMKLLEKSSTGLRAWTNTLSPGDHTITFSATDHGGLISTASVQVTVVNKPPNEPWINSPPDGDTVTAGCNIIFSGGGYDQEDTFITGPNLVWSSNVDGVIGTGSEIKNKLNTPGTQLVRLTATDSAGESSSKEHMVNVNPANAGCPPTVRIVSPAREGKGAVVIFSPQQLTLVGTAEDAEDSPDALQYAWELKPIIPAGAAQNIGNNIVVEDFLFEAPGADKLYEITFTVTDTDGNTAEDKMEILVLSEPIL